MLNNSNPKLIGKVHRQNRYLSNTNNLGKPFSICLHNLQTQLLLT